MRIYSMTATFGKLEHETLSLSPGLNIIEAPNEWGKTTWCAFLAAMLYGLDTRAKSTKTSLADKERFSPWSGSPMAGRMDLEWNGRDITIERKTKGRVPLGQFTAYETHSGLPVPELTAANCGQQLLGVERDVFIRAGFIRAGDLSVTQNESLRSRLNALVTTGDESGDADRLGKALKDLKNRCRYNRSGLLPQAEAQRDTLEGKLRDLESLEADSQRLTRRRDELREWNAVLHNHQAHLSYAASAERSRQALQAEQSCAEAAATLARQEKDCENLLPRGDAENKLNQLRKLHQSAMDLEMEARMLPSLPQEPTAPAALQGMSGQEAMAQARQDAELYEKLGRKNPLLTILAVIAIASGCVAAIWYRIPGILAALMGGGLLAFSLVKQNQRSKKAAELARRYGSEVPAQWISLAEKWAAALAEWEIGCRQHRSSQQELQQRLTLLRQQMDTLTGGRDPRTAQIEWESVITAWDALTNARKEAAVARKYQQMLACAAPVPEKPETPDTLSYSEAETARLLSDAAADLSHCEKQLSQVQGRMEQLGDPEAMTAALTKISRRIAKLEDTYAALDIALGTLNEASMELQRRFAPRISKRAQELMAAFTNGRYDRLTLGEDLGLKAGAAQEDTLHDILWRSEGTTDQLYLALRLAVAEALTGDAPVILDDALVRFDDDRLKAALKVLKQESEEKQVILFTCQSREQALINEI